MNAFGCSGGWTGTEKRYVAKEWGLSPSSDPRVTYRPPWASLSFGDPGLQILKTLEVMSAPSPPASAHMWSFCPTSACNGLFTGLPQIHPHQASRAWLTSRKIRRRPGTVPPSCHLCLPPLLFLPHSLHLLCSWELCILSPLLQRAVGLSPAPFQRSSPNSGPQQNQGLLFIKNLFGITNSNCFPY